MSNEDLERFPFERAGGTASPGGKDQELLELERKNGSPLRSHSVEEAAMESSSPNVQSNQGTDSDRQSSDAQVRQYLVRQSKSPSAGNTEGQYPGRHEQGKVPERNDVEGSVRPGTSAPAVSQWQKSVSALQSDKGQGLPREAREAIRATLNGLLVGQTFEEQFRLAKAYHASRLMPRNLDSPEKVLVAVQMCRELGLPPMTSLSRICVINGSPSIFGDLPLALVMKSGLCLGITEDFIDKEGKRVQANSEHLFGARCIVQRKGHSSGVERTFTIDDAKRAGLWNKKSDSGKPSPWVLYPSRMMQMRSRSWALKDTFPDVLMGISILEYDHDEVLETVVETGHSLAKELNEKYPEEKDDASLRQGVGPAEDNPAQA